MFQVTIVLPVGDPSQEVLVAITKFQPKSIMSFFKGLYFFSLCFLLYSPCFFPRDASDNAAWYLMQLHWLLQNLFCPSAGACPCAGCRGECFPTAGSKDRPGSATAPLLPIPEKWMLTAASQQTGVYLPAPSASLLAWIKGSRSTRSVRRGPLSPKCLMQGWDMVQAEPLHCKSPHKSVRSVPLHLATAVCGLAESFGVYCHWEYIH